MNNEDAKRQIILMLCEFRNTVERLRKERDEAEALGDTAKIEKLDALDKHMDRWARQTGLIPPDPFDVKV